MVSRLIGIEIGKLRSKLYRLQRQHYANEAEMKMTVEEFILLNMINEKTDQISQSIAIATGKNKSVVMRMLDSLEEKDLVRRTPNPADRRENLLNITEEGEKTVRQYYGIERRLSEKLIEGIEPNDLKIFWNVLDRISAKSKEI